MACGGNYGEHMEACNPKALRSTEQELADEEFEMKARWLALLDLFMHVVAVLPAGLSLSLQADWPNAFWAKEALNAFLAW